MGKSIRSKRMRRNRREKRTRYGPKEETKLKNAIAFEYNDKTEKEHLSIFHDVMNGPPPAVPGLEPGSKLAKAHLTLGHETQEKIGELLQKRSNLKIASAIRALTRGVEHKTAHPKEQDKKPVQEENKMDDSVVRVYDEKTQRDQFGQYPAWMSNKTIRSKAHANKVEKKKRRAKIRKGKTVRPVKPKAADEDEEMSDMD